MYFLIGLEAGDIFLKRGFNSWPWGTPLTLFFMYCGSQVSIEMKNWEIWKELAKLSDEHTNWFWMYILKLCVFFSPLLNVYFVCFDWFPIVFMKLLGEFLLDPAWHCNVVNNPIMLAPSLLQGSIGKSRKGNLAWDTNLFLGGAVLPTSPEES